MKFGGYCYYLTRSTVEGWWRGCDDELWLPELTSANATKLLGYRGIDDATCAVFKCDDGKIRAVTMPAAQAMIGNMK